MKSVKYIILFAIFSLNSLNLNSDFHNSDSINLNEKLDLIIEKLDSLKKELKMHEKETNKAHKKLEAKPKRKNCNHKSKLK